MDRDRDSHQSLIHEDSRYYTKLPNKDVSIGLEPSPDNPVDKAAEFLPRALEAIQKNFKESFFLFSLLGYFFIAAFGHMEHLVNYLGYFFVLLIIVLIYLLWDKFTKKDVLYLLIVFFIALFQFHQSLFNWIKIILLR